MLINLIYLYSIDVEFIRIMNIISIECVNCGFIAILLGTAVIYYGQKNVVNSKYTYILIVIAGIVISLHSFIPSGVIVNELNPECTALFGYSEMVYSQLIMLSVFIISLKFYRELSSEMKNKFRKFLIGIIFIDITFLCVIIDNLNILPSLSLIFQLLNFSVLIGAILMYLGIVRRL